ncbi:MAG: hypothetical protein ISS01_01020, partial [Nanoarchaeota archaeon]|nr:hypothetical protein [Nanoarchaeota archaeon]
TLLLDTSIAYLNYQGFDIEPPNLHSYLDAFVLYGSTFLTTITAASTFYAAKYSKERIHDNFGIPFREYYNYYHGMGYCPKVGFELAAEDLGFEIPDWNPEDILKKLYTNVKTPRDITEYIRETSSSLTQELGLEKTLEIFIETTGMDVDLTYNKSGEFNGFIPKIHQSLDPIEVN